MEPRLYSLFSKAPKWDDPATDKIERAASPPTPEGGPHSHFDVSFRGFDCQASHEPRPWISKAHNRLAESSLEDNDHALKTLGFNRTRTYSEAKNRKSSVGFQTSTAVGKPRSMMSRFLPPNDEGDGPALKQAYASKISLDISESRQRTRPSSSYSFKSQEAVEARRSESKLRIREDLLKRLGASATQTYYNLGSSQSIKPARQIFVAPAQPKARNQDRKTRVKAEEVSRRHKEVQCCGACDALRVAFFS